MNERKNSEDAFYTLRNMIIIGLISIILVLALAPQIILLLHKVFFKDQEKQTTQLTTESVQELLVDDLYISNSSDSANYSEIENSEIKEQLSFCITVYQIILGIWIIAHIIFFSSLDVNSLSNSKKKYKKRE